MQTKKPSPLLITTILAATCFISAQLAYAEDSIDISSAAANDHETKSFCDHNCRNDLQKKLDDYRVKNNIPAITMTINKGNLTLNFYSGTMAKNSRIPVDHNSLFEIGSVTKTHTAIILLQLEAEGKLNIEDKIGKWVPEYSAWKDISIKQLLNMTSGVRDYYTDSLNKVYADPEHLWPWQEVLHTAYDHTPNIDFLPGTSYKYSNTGYVLAGLIIERVTGKTVKANMETRIFKPLGLKHTIYDPNLIPAKLPNMVHGYCEFLEPKEYYDVDITNQSITSYSETAGGIISTSKDTTKFIRALFSKNFRLPEQQFQELTSLVCADTRCKPGEPLPPNTDKIGFALGMQWLPLDSSLGFEYPIGTWYKAGETEGFFHIWMYFPSKDMIITTASDVDSPEDDANRLYFYANIFKYFYPHG
jgi:D-alanyl-D-alanine carboxypeptidase